MSEPEIHQDDVRELMSSALNNIKSCLRRRGFTETSIKNFIEKTQEKDLTSRFLGDITCTPDQWIKHIINYLNTDKEETLIIEALETFKLMREKRLILPEGTMDFIKGLNLELVRTHFNPTFTAETARATATTTASTTVRARAMSPMIVTPKRYEERRKVKIETLKSSNQNVLEWFRSFERKTPGWDDDERGKEVVMFLEEQCARTWESMPLNEKYSYESIKSSLTSKYGPVECTKRMQAKLMLESQSGQESVIDFHDRLHSYAVYFDDQDEFREAIKASFIENLRPLIKIGLDQYKNESLDDILRIARKREKDLADSNAYELTAPIRTADDRCYKCRKPGHIAKNCTKNNEFFRRSSTEQIKRKPDSNTKSTETCQWCNKLGHSARNCWFITKNKDQKSEPTERKEKKFCTNCNMKNHNTEECFKPKQQRADTSNDTRKQESKKV
jgi:hypothetical protein